MTARLRRSRRSRLFAPWIQGLRPGAETRRGAAIGLITLSLLIMVLYGRDVQTGFGPIVDMLLGLLLGALGIWGIVKLTAVLLGWLRRLSPEFTGIVLATVVVLFAFALNINMSAMWPLALIAIFAAATLGGSVWLLMHGDSRPLVLFVAMVALLVAGAGIAWLAWPGPAEGRGALARAEASRAEASVVPLDMPDPGEGGPYDVETFTYGSGTDRRRPEYGAGADWTSTSVDATAFVQLDGFNAWLRRWYWGFTPAAYPLNGRVWSPVGEGPFPLALIVHGNHDMDDYSDAGYAYLGEHLASHGFILVSVDQNFLNGYFAGSMSDENDARGWLLLEHLAEWRDWAQAPGHPFFQRVDLDHVAVMGHSRGGEAAAIAAAFNRLARYPDNADVTFDYGFGIGAVVAIGPSDRQYEPADQPLPLSDVNYLLLQGSYDADSDDYLGFRQFGRMAFTNPSADWFKAGLYIDGANHGQFNSDWGRADLGWPRRLLLNTAPILPEAEQQQIANVVITAFLKTTLLGEDGYRRFFQDYRTGLAWLPPTRYINQYRGSSFHPLATFEEDIDVTTASLTGGMISANGVVSWREREVPSRKGYGLGTNAVYLAWHEAGADVHYSLALPPLNLGEDDRLVFDLANATGDPASLIDFSVEICDAETTCVRLPISAWLSLSPPFAARFSKWPLWEKEEFQRSVDTIFQSYHLPLSSFAAANPTLDLARISTIRFRFDRSESGQIYLDEIGVAME